MNKLSNNQLLLLAALVLGIGCVVYNCKNKKGGVREPFMDIQLMQNPQLTYFQSPSAYSMGGPEARMGQPLKEGRILGPGAELQYQGVVPMGHQGTNRMAPNQCSGYAQMVHDDGKSLQEMEAEIHAKLAKKLQMPDTKDLLPELDGDCPFTMGGEFDPTSSANWLPARQIFALRKGRYQADNDMVRGSLRIAPTATDWFNSSPQPANDLVTGALQMGAVGADMPSSLEGEGLFVQNMRLQTGLNRLDLISGEHCA